MVHIAAVTGIIEAVKGVISLVLPLFGNRSKLKLERAYFKKGGFESFRPRGKETVGVQLTLDNLGDKSTTVKRIYIQIGNHVVWDKLFKPRLIKGNSSESFEFHFHFSEKDWEEITQPKKMEFGVTIDHTFKTIKKLEKSSFSTGYFTLK